MQDPTTPISAPPRPCDFVVIGGTGDLAVRKLLPALLHCDDDDRLSPDSRVVGLSLAGLDTAAYRAKVRGELADVDVPDSTLDRFLERVSYASLDFQDPAGWEVVRPMLGGDDGDDSRVRVFYLAIAPALFGPVCRRLREAGLVTADSRVVLEKPIGSDLASSQDINDAVGEVFDEQQIFRIDHYLGKESVQNLLVTRFGNTFLEPLWNSTWIDHVQITVAETLGVGARAGYYDSAGALRDMVQNHLLQLLCLVAMEPPTYVDRETVRDEKLKVLQALRPLDEGDLGGSVVIGQYAAGLVDGQAVPSYLTEVDDPSSRTETFVAMKAHVDNWRWAGVPFYLRTGKRMDRGCSEIVITFKPVPHRMFPGNGDPEPNRLVIQLQPEEGMKLHITTKEPGPGGMRLRRASLDLSYAESYGGRLPLAYERLLTDVVRGSTTLFMRRDEVEAAWTWLEPLLTAWQSPGRTRPKSYPAGTPGPIAATTLIERDGRAWHESATS
ncbi:glucose-6-phosphate dehydrogenase [Nocardioides marmoribigeumensis]|uniref:Glucose-6-phosphate 1-dehydrogenase n=1 Tax=Nocardioides marmoribigeumensis TaxID=433649 RepID=A0ABU2BY33_9ACTN|nr:glucose-6-phosphate dehydrogenase [Nocardioides marmoribigeumensis]MDR7363307.1 glucose-6-phosphate 1-dehydrogenase [Nocardioides marmoribigeumensis]